ncbi:hypothetical protein COOONC_23176 [Cooperia oncophora]
MKLSRLQLTLVYILCGLLVITLEDSTAASAGAAGSTAAAKAGSVASQASTEATEPTEHDTKEVTEPSPPTPQAQHKGDNKKKKGVQSITIPIGLGVGMLVAHLLN